MPHLNKKPLARNEHLVQTNENMPRINFEWIGKNKIEKTVKIKVKLPHGNRKPLARKRMFVQTFDNFLLYLKIIAKSFHARKPLAFSLHFLFRRDQNHYSNLTSKIMKMCEQILKKDIAGQVLTYNSKNFH